MKSFERIVLFDVDGTLTLARQHIGIDMIETLKKLQEKCHVAIVGGSDLVKISEQVGKEVIQNVDYVFSENGLHSLKKGVVFHTQSLKDYIGDNNLQQFLNYTLMELSQIQLPVKRGTFIEYRNGMLNISPIGRNCSQQERDDFEVYDKQHLIRKQLIDKLQNKFNHLGLKYSIGGQISFDVFPIGWDKTYCLQFVKEFQQIYFFGDKTFEGGNDYEIFSDERTQGYQVDSPQATIKLINELFLI